MHGRTSWLALLVAIVALVAACGVPSDAAPRDIVDEAGQVPREPTPAPVGELGPKVYFLGAETSAGAERLQPANRSVAPTPESVLNALLAGLTVDEQARRWRTAIPGDTELHTAEVDGEGTLVVDLSEAFFQATGDFQVRAVAQVVFTGSEIEGVDRVQLLVDGQPQEWPRGDGSLQAEPLTRSAYPDLNPTTQPEYPPLPSPTVAG
jgi:spore germination protein GerM